MEEPGLSEQPPSQAEPVPGPDEGHVGQALCGGGPLRQGGCQTPLLLI